VLQEPTLPTSATPTTLRPEITPLPAAHAPERVALIGTAQTLRELRLQLALLKPTPSIVGSFLVPDAPDFPAPASHTTNAADSNSLASINDLTTSWHVRPFATAYIALPRSHAATAQRLRAQLHAIGVDTRAITPIAEQFAPRSSQPVTFASPVDLVDLIGRSPYSIDRAMVLRAIQGKRVLITGAGGSIGSEIARIVATFEPSELILFERAENALFEIDRQIARRAPSLARRSVLHDVTDEELTRLRVMDLAPHVVFHAAAHKHVPLMEDHPADAVTNNFFGTKSIADAALAAHAERFVLISSDKAVNPSSVMGATKRLAEMYIQALHAHSSARTAAGTQTQFSMVRFGNVLGSACSVLPIWSSQIADGGPITVTDPRMTRYFMTIPEAAALVIQAGALDAHANAALYVLDMGEPVRIVDLAERFVRSRGYSPRIIDARPGLRVTAPDHANPAVDPLADTRIDDAIAEFDDLSAHHTHPEMEIVLTGARPGEKLHEELAYAAEQLRPTRSPGINAWAGPLHANFNLATLVADLANIRRSWDRAEVINIIRKHVPEMHSTSTSHAATRAAA
jgi:FlaA1/EpsC-like NDP-sugar epimerase